MASYDSLSSDDEDGTTSDYTTTSTLLGYASKEPTEDTISHLGGTPVSSSNPLTQSVADIVISRHG
jgi:hypothetical protein